MTRKQKKRRKRMHKKNEARKKALMLEVKEAVCEAAIKKVAPVIVVRTPVVDEPVVPVVNNAMTDRFIQTIVNIQTRALRADGRCHHGMLPMQCSYCAGIPMSKYGASVGAAWI